MEPIRGHLVPAGLESVVTGHSARDGVSAICARLRRYSFSLPASVVGSVAWQRSPAPRHTGRRVTRSSRSVGQHDRAVAEFVWPDVGRAVQLGDRLVRRDRRAATTATALWIVEEDGSRAASYLRRDGRALRPGRRLARRRSGVGQGDRVMLMLGNQVELWETMLAVIKLGAVIMPTTTALGPADLADRVDRGGARLVDRQRRGRRRSSTRCPATTCGARRATADGWHAYADAAAVAADDAFETSPRPSDPLLLYFTSGHHQQAEARRAHPGLLPGRPPVDDVLDRRCGPATCTSASARPAGRSTRWCCFFAPWIAEATIFVYNYARFDAARAAGPDPAGRGDDLLRAADGVADADPGRPQRRQGRPARAARGG